MLEDEGEPGFFLYSGRCLGIDWYLEWVTYGARSNAQVISGDVVGGTEQVWLGTVLEDRQDASGLLYRRNRYYNPEQGRFIQEDPIGLAGGLNLYGYANGDPVNFSDPFGLCPMCYVAFEVAASIYDAGDLAVTGIRYLRGKASGAELSVTAAGAAAGVVGFGGGYGRAARAGVEQAGKAAVGRLIKDATDNPGNWKTVGAFTEPAMNQKARGGTSIQAILENQDGDRLVRHTVVDRNGRVIDDHFRPMYKSRDVDQR